MFLAIHFRKLNYHLLEISMKFISFSLRRDNYSLVNCWRKSFVYEFRHTPEYLRCLLSRFFTIVALLLRHAIKNVIFFSRTNIRIKSYIIPRFIADRSTKLLSNFLGKFFGRICVENKKRLKNYISLEILISFLKDSLNIH